MFIFSQTLIQYQRQLESEINELDSKISLLPEGRLLIIKDGSRLKWKHSLNGKISYISKKDRAFAEDLALKKYYIFRREELITELKSLEKFMSKIPEIQLNNSTTTSFFNSNTALSKSQELLVNSRYSELLTDNVKTKNQEYIEWMNSDYETNENHPEHKIHKCISGNIVRSKSEALIDTALMTHGLAYRYESVLYLEGKVLCPDFVVIDPITGGFKYWEHLGMIDDFNYWSQASMKISVYTRNGIIPGRNLILTYETAEAPLTQEYVEKTIFMYFGL